MFCSCMSEIEIFYVIVALIAVIIAIEFNELIIIGKHVGKVWILTN